MEITLKNLRRRAGLTQRQAAKLVGTTPAHLSQWESGDIRPRENKVPKFVAVYGCTADEVVEAIWGDERGTR